MVILFSFLIKTRYLFLEYFNVGNINHNGAIYDWQYILVVHMCPIVLHRDKSDVCYLTYCASIFYFIFYNYTKEKITSTFKK